VEYNKIFLWDSELDNFEKIDKDLMKFYFEQAEKSLKSTLELADKISVRAYALLAVVVPVMSIIFSNLSKNYFGIELLSCQLLGLLWLLLIPIAISFVLLIKVVFPKDYYQLGREPKYIVKKEYYDNPEYPKEESYKLVLSYELENYQYRVSYMDDMNNIRVKSIKTAFRVSMGALSVFVLMLIIKMFSLGELSVLYQALVGQ
jgi:hypothetical protein